MRKNEERIYDEWEEDLNCSDEADVQRMLQNIKVKLEQDDGYEEYIDLSDM